MDDDDRESRASSFSSVSTASGNELVGDGSDSRQRMRSHLDVLALRASSISPKWETDNTSNFWKHIKTQHRAIYDRIVPPRERGPDDGSLVGLSNGVFTKADQDRATLALVHLVVKHAHPYAIVDQKGFLEYSRALQPAYKVPCRQTITAKVEQSWEDRKDAVRQILRWDLRDGRRASLTTDMWTSSANRGYTYGGYTPLNRRKMMNPQVATSVWTLTADNAKNNQTMVDTLCDDLMEPSEGAGAGEKRIKYIRCLAHVLQLAVKSGIKNCGDMNEALGGLREVVKKMGDSPKLFEKYQDVCKTMSPPVKPKGFPLDVPTRWNSTYDMIEVLLESRQQLEVMLQRIRFGHAGYRDLTIDAEATIRFTPDVWDYAARFHAFLGPIADATTMISGSQYPTLGSAVAIYEMVSYHVNNSVRDATTNLHRLTAAQALPVATPRLQPAARVEIHDSGSTSAQADTASVSAAKHNAALAAANRAVSFFTAVQTKLEKYRGHVLCRAAKIAGGVDPRFKSFADEDTHQPIISTFTNKYQAYFEANRRPREPGMMSPPAKYPKLIKIMNEMNGTRGQRRVRNSIQEEVEDWFSTPSLMLDLSSRGVCDWFGLNAAGFPRIALIARDHLAIPATSVPSEVAFSKAGSAVEDRRSRLLDRSVRAIMELQSYLAFLDPEEQKRRVLVYAETEYFGCT